MDRAPTGAEEAAREAIAALGPGVELRRLRMRQAGGRQFADVVIGVAPSAAVGQGHAAADAVEAAVRARAAGKRRRRARGARRRGRPARARPRRGGGRSRGARDPQRDLVEVDGRTELSLHVKLPGGMTLVEAHDVAEQLESAIRAAVPVRRLGADPPRAADGDRRRARSSRATRPSVERIVVEETGAAAPREVRFLQTDAGPRRLPHARPRRRLEPRRRPHPCERDRGAASGSRRPRSPTSSSIPSPPPTEKGAP